MRILCFLLLTLTFFSCGADSEAGKWKPLDLMRYNVPITIAAPDSAKVKATNLSGIMQDVTIKSTEDRYSVQVLASRAAYNDLARLKADQLDLVRENRYFESVVREEDQGFIFMNMIDSTSIYGFRYIVYQGDQEFVFQNAFDGTFNLAEIEAMYAAVKQ